MKKSNLDERQEQDLLKIEHNACWFAFWGLLAVLAVEFVVYGANRIEIFAGEWLVFMCLSLYLSFACSKKGIWDRHLKPNMLTNLILSLVAGVITGLVSALAIGRVYPDKVLGTIAAGVFMGGFVAVFCFVVLVIAAEFHKRKRLKEEAEPEEE